MQILVVTTFTCAIVSACAADLRLVTIDSFGHSIEPERVTLGPLGAPRKVLKGPSDYQGIAPGQYKLGVQFKRHETIVMDIQLREGSNEVLVAAEERSFWVSPAPPKRIGGKVMGHWKSSDGKARVECSGVFLTDSGSASVAADGTFEIHLGRDGKYTCVLSIGANVVATRIVDLEGGYHWLTLKLE